jgi:hypothetical protein
VEIPKALTLGASLAFASWAIGATAAEPTSPCDFNGLSVGDRATPEQIMNHYGIQKFHSGEAPSSDSQRVAQVGLMNQIDEQESKLGPACDAEECRIPSGLSLGTGPTAIPVRLYVRFDSAGVVKLITVAYDKAKWDQALEIINSKYGDNWSRWVTDDVTTDFEHKASKPDSTTLLTHKTLGKNPRTAVQCLVSVDSRDSPFVHSIAPFYRATLEIRAQDP